eukprot:GILK01007732.1.p1 GENE.GILK01007732.1~~GILK01007732.1.p1  ORF type:complete len:254 (-),score=33.46 GILK01007732.1:90-851(-)
MRGQMWQVFANVKHYRSQNVGVYEQLILQKEVPFEEYIKRDVPRLAPKVPSFLDCDGEGQQAMSRILKAFSLFQPEIGYTASLGCMTAMLMQHMGEEDCFWMLSLLMDKYRMGDVLKPGMPNLKLYFYQFEQLMQRFLPKLHKHFTTIGLGVEIFGALWFMTLYTYKFPLPLTSRIWDIFLAEGIKIIFRVALALLQLKKDELVGAAFEDIMNVLGNLHESIDENRLIATAISIKVTPKMLEALEDSYRKMPS